MLRRTLEPRLHSPEFERSRRSEKMRGPRKHLPPDRLPCGFRAACCQLANHRASQLGCMAPGLPAFLHAIIDYYKSR
jgi:hypothetical protein